MLVLGALGQTARADDSETGSTSTKGTEQQLVLVNATPKLGSIGGIDRVRRVLDSRGLIHRLPENLEAVLDGRNVAVVDIDAIRKAVEDTDYKTAVKLINDDEKRILQSVASGDPIPALAELSQWRGFVAAAQSDEPGATNWFRTALRFNPAWAPDRKLASPLVRRLVKDARQEATEMGKLRVDVEPDDAQVRVDGKGIHAAREKIELEVGWHLVIVSSPTRAPYAELVEIKEGKTEKLDLTLPKEGNDDRAARLVDATVSAPPGKNRLKMAKPLSRLTGVTRILYVEDATEDHIVLRLYDLETKKVSQAIELDSKASSAAITRKVLAALDGDNMVDPGSVVVIDRSGPTPWYNHWYVWVGVAVVAGAAFGTYEYATRQPTAVRF